MSKGENTKLEFIHQRNRNFENNIIEKSQDDKNGYFIRRLLFLKPCIRKK